MKRKLNISIDHELKLFAFEYAKSHNTSVSQVVEEYFRRLQQKETPEIKSPQVKALLNSLNLDPGENWKEKRLKEKYN